MGPNSLYLISWISLEMSRFRLSSLWFLWQADPELAADVHENPRCDPFESRRTCRTVPELSANLELQGLMGTCCGLTTGKQYFVYILYNTVHNTYT